MKQAKFKTAVQSIKHGLSLRVMLCLAFLLPAACGAFSAQASESPQQKKASAVNSVSGVVYSAEDNEPIVGATVMVEGTSVGTATDLEGKFTIANLPAGAKKIKVSFVGMAPQVLNIKSNMKIVLQSAAESIDDVIVVAYGTAKRSTFTGASSTVNAKSIEQKPVTSVTDALVGTAPGVQVTTANGQPGSSPSIYIRGSGSFSASTTPLIVLDGMPYDNSISSLNPNDIESITILKDAASSALYGARAANGVLMITTKRGSKDRMRVNINVKQGFTAKQTGDYKRVGVNDYVTLYWENLRNQYMTDGKSMEDASADASKYLFQQLALNPFNVPDDQVVDANGNVNPNAKLLWADDTDWEDAVQQLGYRTDIAMSISGGSDKADYFTSVGYTDEKGYIIGSRFKRYTARANANAQITTWLKVGTNLSGNLSYSDGNQNESQNNNINPFRYTRYIGPIYPIHVHNPETGEYVLDANGDKIYDFGYGRDLGNGLEWPVRDYVAGNNPAIELQQRYDSFKRNTLNAKVYAEITFLKDFKFTVNGGVGANSYLASSAAIVYPEKGNTGSADKTNSFTTTWTWNQLLTWDRDFGSHHIDVLLGHESYDYEYNHLAASKKDQSFDNNYELNNYANIDTAPSSYTNKYATEGYLSRLNYDYADKYFFSASFRRDGSSRFYKDSRWGNFWSVGAGWRIDYEKFMEQYSWIDMLKLRASYGEVGNDDVGSYYPWRATYEKSQNAQEPGYIQSSLGNKELKWEVSRNFDVALEFGFLNRFRGTIEYFNRQSDNLLFSVPLSYSTGMTAQDMNAGTMYNRGFEFELEADIFKSRNFDWTVNFNATHYDNKITKLPVDPYTSGVHKIEEGHSRYEFYLRQWRGIDPATGSSLYVVDPELMEASESLVEVNGQTYTTDIQEALYDYTCNALPKVSGGLTSNMRYRDFTLGLTFYYQLGGKMYDTVYSSLMSPGTGSLSYSTLHVDALKRWQKPGDITNVPRISNGTDSSDLTGSSTQWLVSSNLLELAVINLGYSVPKWICNKLQIRDLKFSFSANNVFQITKRQGIYPRKNLGGYASNGDVFLPSRVFTLGLNFTF